MAPLPLHDFHQARGAIFTTQNGSESVGSYGSTEGEYRALTTSCGLIDLTFRSRICLLGADREKFLHGQVTNEILRLPVGQGTYAALVTAKGKLQTDLFVYKLADELLLDFEPGLTAEVSARLEKYVIAEDVQIVDVAPHYGLLSVQGPSATEALQSLRLTASIPSTRLAWTKETLPGGDLYLVNHSRYGSVGYDLLVPNADLLDVAQRLSALGQWVGFEACEIARIENAIPRFTVDMDETNLAPEALDASVISYAKGCYIGQEVIARIRTYGQVAKALRLIRLPAEQQVVPAPRTKLFKDGREVGYITSSCLSPKHAAPVALGYVRKESNEVGATVHVATTDGPVAQIVATPAHL